MKGPVSAGLAAGAVGAARRSDVVLAANAPFGVMAMGLLAARMTGRPLALLPFLHLRDAYHHRRALREILSRADRVLCLSRTTAAFVERTWGTQTALVGGGIDPAEYADADVDGRAFRQLHGLGERPLVVTVARKTPSKGYLMTCEAVAELNRRGLRCEHVLIGPDEDGRPIPSDGGRHLGSLPRAQVLSALAACDVFTLPSLYESFGLAYLEAWMLSKPVIGHSLCDPARELIESGHDGLLVSNVREMADGIASLLADPARRHAFGRHGRRKTLEAHTWPHVVDRARRALADLTRTAGAAS
jgi:glycosyltransferase involved in cell wall biosynthesis